jgi:photosystem II stability/assembly factor-like uncharacterized protein
MISNPFIDSILYNYNSTIFKFTGTYEVCDTLAHGSGYWIKIETPETLQFIGDHSYEDSLRVIKGWNLVGSFSEQTIIDNIYTSSPILLTTGFYAFDKDSGYVLADTLTPGEAYWVKANDSGIVSMSDWELVGLEYDRINAIGLHPSNSNIIYGGSVRDIYTGTPGRIYKSVNGGVSWNILREGSYYLKILIHPTQPETVYALDGGIIKSTNGGIDWQKISDSIDLREKMVNCLDFDPNNPEIIYAGTVGVFFGGGSLYKSTNGGLNWINLLNTHIKIKSGVYSIAIDPNNTQKIYIGIAAIGSILKSTTGGNSWVVTGFNETGTGIQDILIDPRDSQKIYAAIFAGGFIKSDDGGISWNYINNGISGDYWGGIKILINPLNHDLYGVATPDRGWVFCMKDGEDVWKKIGILRVRDTYGTVCDLSITKDGVKLFFGGDRGLFRIVLN